MQLNHFILTFCLIGAIQCARMKREDEESSKAPKEETSKAPEKETSKAPEEETSKAPEEGKATEAPSKTESNDKSPFPEAVGAWFGQAFGSSGDVDWVKQAQSIFSNVPWYPKPK